MVLNKYNNILTSGSWSTKDPKDAHILALVGVAHNIMYDSKKTSDRSSRESTKGEPAYIKDIPTWILENQKEGELKNTKNGK